MNRVVRSSGLPRKRPPPKQELFQQDFLLGRLNADAFSFYLAGHARHGGPEMVRSQGKYFSKSELDRIVMLLRESDMTLPEIADRMRCSRSAVAAINRKFQIRLYEGKRSQWSLKLQELTAVES
jgi:hypothetical protein